MQHRDFRNPGHFSAVWKQGDGLMVTESGQLDLVAVLGEQLRPIEDGIATLETTINPQIDANPNDKLLMEMLDVVSDARESIEELRDLLQTMEQRDRESG
jgi:hypothetical protein